MKVVSTSARVLLAVGALALTVGLAAPADAADPTVIELESPMICAPGWRQPDWQPGLCVLTEYATSFNAPAGARAVEVTTTAISDNNPQLEECATVTVGDGSALICTQRPELAPSTATFSIPIAVASVGVNAVHLGDALPAPYKAGDWVNNFTPGSMHVVIRVTWQVEPTTTTASPPATDPPASSSSIATPTTQPLASSSTLGPEPTTTVAPADPTTTTPPTVAAPTTPAPTVLGDEVVATLPRTGSAVGPLVRLGIGAIGLGAGLLVVGRRHRQANASNGGPDDESF